MERITKIQWEEVKTQTSPLYSTAGYDFYPGWYRIGNTLFEIFESPNEEGFGRYKEVAKVGIDELATTLAKMEGIINKQINGNAHLSMDLYSDKSWGIMLRVNWRDTVEVFGHERREGEEFGGIEWTAKELIRKYKSEKKQS